jgi:hypothetical protein
MVPGGGRGAIVFFQRCYNSPMGMKKVTRRFAAWLACCAILFAALAPSISHAMAASLGDTWAEICGVGGSKFVKVAEVDAGAPASESPTMAHVEHCPFCATHAGSFALLPGGGAVMPLREPESPHPFLFFHAPSPLAVWVAAPSRAPPALA